ncbi:DUF11 domain-containing protein [Leucobacter viscericola]|uniref:DUF11 domain-containing protein n=1 Tax=Leucobacter viscericola TaxID=2714935 RepID=A0A6G7XHQ1_9MICO|nr:invasin domain 3-containing protein [Leucobacter viscericola]QIK63898.1 DUF11 domain-containing protein [Leucobacter viscericola]
MFHKLKYRSQVAPKVEPRSRNHIRILRPLALGAVALLGFSGLTISGADQALAVTNVTNGRIQIDQPNPVSEITLANGYRQQYYSRTLGGKAFYGSGGYPVFFDAGRNKSIPLPSETQASGGTGTVGDPFWLETSGVFSDPAYAGSTFTQRLSYVIGTEYMRNDMTITNNSSETQNIQFGQYADCFFNGDDNGTSRVVSGQMVQCVQGSKAMSLIAVTPGAAFAGGHYIGVRKKVLGDFVGTASADKCFNSSSLEMNCNTYLDNGFGMVWKDQIAPGSTVTKTGYLSYTDKLAFVNLTPESAVSSTSVRPNQNVTYKLSVKNAGPSASEGTKVAFALPAGFSYVSASGTGSYNAAAGTWEIGTIGINGEATIEIVAKALQPGEWTTKTTATASDGIDTAPCQADDSCGSPLTVTVLATGVAANSTITAAPAQLTADGTSQSTITVTAYDAAGDPVGFGGAKVVLATDLGTLSNVKDNGDGTYTATLTSTKSGPATVSVELNDETVPRTALVQFNAGAVATAKYSVTDDVQVVGTGQHTITITLADAHNNPVLGKAGKLTASAAPGLGDGEISAFNATGTPGSTRPQSPPPLRNHKPSQ